MLCSSNYKASAHKAASGGSQYELSDSLFKASGNKSGVATTRDGRQINGIARTKPTNLVIPSMHPSQSGGSSSALLKVSLEQVSIRDKCLELNVVPLRSMWYI